MSEYYVGIDLGTTNSEIAIYRRGIPETLMVEGEYVVPSVVHFKNKDEYLVGHQAKRMMMVDQENTIGSNKRNMGKQGFSYDIYGKQYAPPEISAKVIEKLVNGVKEEIGPVRKAVITVPAYFNDDQRADTKKAAELAGLEVLRLLSEPTAAAIAYGLNQGKEQTILVYDLGGGTFDVSILEIKGNTFIVKAVGGDHQLGGDDLDRTLMDYVLLEAGIKRLVAKSDFVDENLVPRLLEGGIIKDDKDNPDYACFDVMIENEDQLRECLEQIDIDEIEPILTIWRQSLDLGGFKESPEILVAKQSLKETCENAKKELSVSKSTVIDIPDFIKGKNIHQEITQEKFHQLISIHIEKTISIVSDTLESAQLFPDNIDRVVLVGGSTNIPLIKQLITAKIKEPYVAENVSEIVASGAAIVAAYYMAISDSEGKESILREILFSEVYPYRLGIAVADIVSEDEVDQFKLLSRKNGLALVEGVFEELISKNSTFPVTKTKGVSTIQDYQKCIEVKVYRGDREGNSEKESCSNMEFLGDFIVSGIQQARAGIPEIEVSFNIDENGILAIIAQDRNTQATAKTSINLDVKRVVKRDFASI